MSCVGGTLVILDGWEGRVFAAEGVYLPDDPDWEALALYGVGLTALLAFVGNELRPRRPRLTPVADADGQRDDAPEPWDETSADNTPLPPGPLLAPASLLTLDAGASSIPIPHTLRRLTANPMRLTGTV